MGRFGFHVIDADGHGGEADDWHERIPAEHQPAYARWKAHCAEHFGKLTLPGAGLARKGDAFEQRDGMIEPKARLDDMDLEGIDVTVTYPGGAGEEVSFRARPEVFGGSSARSVRVDCVGIGVGEVDLRGSPPVT